MRSLLRASVLVLSTLAAERVGAQPPSASAATGATTANQPSAADLQRAAALFNASDWTAAHAAYAALAARFPAHPQSRFRTGVTLTELGRAREAEPLLRQGEQLGIPAGQAAYRLAESLAEQQKGDAALLELERALRGGVVFPSQTLIANVHLASLKQHPRWPAVLLAFDAVTQPCQADPRFRQFDFWVGDWEVRGTGAPAGSPASRNRITLEENGCVVQEHWEGQSGSTGQSFNLFDRSIGKWRQTWVDNGGGQHDYVGELKDGHMVFEGTTPAPRGALGRIPTRLTLFHLHADTVRQFAQVSNDGGTTWTTSYDLTYVRRKP